MSQLKNIQTKQNPSGIWKSAITPGRNCNPLAGYTPEQLLLVLISFHEFLAKKECYKTWHSTLHVDENNLMPLLKICASFTQDEKALKQFGMRMNRGVLICGAPGQGKTHILNLLRQLKANFNRESSFGMIDTLTIAHDYEKFGSEAIKSYSYKRNYKNNLMDYAYDDILAEREVRHYGGQDILVMPEVIFIRERLMNAEGILTHFTTNLRSEMIKEVYKERAFDRILQMCDPVVFLPEAKNWRNGLLI
jgi:broad-specificity NMP kinase